MKATIAVAATAFVSGALAVAQPDLSIFNQAPSIPGLDKLSPETMAKAKKIFDYYYPPCSQSCAVGAFQKAGLDISNPTPSAICRATFVDDFKSCSKSKCSAELYTRVDQVLTNLCYAITPKCALKCVFPPPDLGDLQGLVAGSPLAGLIPGVGGGASGAGEEGRRIRSLKSVSLEMPKCPPFNLYCSCKDDYGAWYKECLAKSCDNKEDIAHQTNTGLTLCAQLPPKCSLDCMKDTPAKLDCHPTEDPECMCSAKVQTALTQCVASSQCTAEEKALVQKQSDSHCKFNKAFLDTLPKIPSKLAEMGLPAPAAIPTSVAALKDTMKQISDGINGLIGGLGGFLGGGGGEDAAAPDGVSAPGTDSGEEVATSFGGGPSRVRVIKSMAALVKKLTAAPTKTA